MCNQPNTYRIDDLDQLEGRIARIQELGTSTYVTLTSGITVELGVDLCDGCDEPAGWACSCAMTADQPMALAA